MKKKKNIRFRNMKTKLVQKCVKKQEIKDVLGDWRPLKENLKFFPQLIVMVTESKYVKEKNPEWMGRKNVPHLIVNN